MHFLSASTLFNFIQCSHRVWRDVYGPLDEKVLEPNPFVQLLWDKGVLHEGRVIESIGQFVDVRDGSYEDRSERTLAAMQGGADLIYQGVLIYGNYLGIPDLLKRNSDGTYMPIDIKSGRGFEGSDEEGDEKYKKHYAIQLCHYVELLKQLGFAKSDKAKIIDINNNEVIYDLQTAIGIKNKNTWWEYYFEIRAEVEDLLANKKENKPAMAGICKLCPWYYSCKKWAAGTNDLTNIFYLGRSKRDTLNEDLNITRVGQMQTIDIDQILKHKATDKNFLRGIGPATLTKIVARAKILQTKSAPVIYTKIKFPDKSYELYFDIEDDPTQEIVYLHGIYERSPSGERFVSFVADDTSKESEKLAWQKFWDYIRSLPKDDYAVYYYSQHEHTVYKKMRDEYPDVVSEKELEDFFDKERAIDLYTHVILPYTDWPLGSYSVKEIAQYLGFKWRDATPSGALSIQWYNDYLKDRDPGKLTRILEYNEDDCKATMVIKDYLAKKV